MGQLGIGNIALCILWFQGHIQHPGVIHARSLFVG